MFPEEIEALQDVGYRIVFSDEDRQLRVAVSEFRDSLYLSFRWWRKGFDETDWYATKEGITVPYTMESVSRFMGALTGLLSDGEVLAHFSEYGITVPPKITKEESDEGLT